MLHTSLLLMKRLSKTETPIFLYVLCSLFLKAIFFFDVWGWSGGAKVSCILHHRGVQLIG